MSIRLKSLDQQTLVITGASSGMGLATARMAAAAGAKVFLGARDGEALDRICAAIEQDGGIASYLALDVADEEAVAALASAAIEKFGGFDTWVNVAGVGLIAPLKDTSTEDHRRLFETNYWGVVYGALTAARYFRQAGKPGAIITVGSAASDIAAPVAGAYSASKFAVKAFTNVLRIELMQEKLPVSVTLIKPSAIDSKFADHAKTTLGGATTLPPPRYEPAVVGKAILSAAQHPLREIAVGSPALIGGRIAVLLPKLVEALFSRVDPSSVVDKNLPPPSDDNLYAAPREGQERSGHNSARSFSVTTAAQTHPRTSLLLSVITGVGFLAWRRSRRKLANRH